MIGSPDRIECRFEKLIADLICSGKATIQIEDKRFDHGENRNLLRRRFPANPLGVRVDIKGLAAKKADEGLIALLCEFDSKTGRRRDGSNDWHTGGKGFLDYLERSTTAH
jgi:hypothetical protein